MRLEIYVVLPATAAADRPACAHRGPRPGRCHCAPGSPTPRNAEEARTAVRALKAAGVDAVKFQRDDAGWLVDGRAPVLSNDVIRAIADEAHRQQLKVYVHAPQLAHAKEALRAGTDGLLHGVIDEPVDTAFIELMKKNQAVYVTTVALFEDIGDVAGFAQRQGVNWDRAKLDPPEMYKFFTTPAGAKQVAGMFPKVPAVKRQLATAKANLKKVFDAGIPVVLGTDTGFVGVFLGVATQIELELLVEAGLRPHEALKSATINAARMIGREKELGSVEAGKHADLLVLDANPLDDIRNVARIHKVIKGGVVRDPIDPSPNR